MLIYLCMYIWIFYHPLSFALSISSFSHFLFCFFFFVPSLPPLSQSRWPSSLLFHLSLASSCPPALLSVWKQDTIWLTVWMLTDVCLMVWGSDSCRMMCLWWQSCTRLTHYQSINRQCTSWYPLGWWRPASCALVVQLRSISRGGCVEPFIDTALVLALVRNLSRLQALAWLAPCRYDFLLWASLCHGVWSRRRRRLKSRQGLRDGPCQVPALGVGARGRGVNN